MELQANQALYCEHLSFPVHGTDMDKLKNDLTVNNGRRHVYEFLGVKTNEPPEIFLYKICGDRVIVPRHYVPKRLPDSKPLTYIHLPLQTKPFSVNCNIRLRNNIQEVAANALQAKNESSLPKDKILCLHCGAGKTCVALYAAHKSNRFPALVIVHTTALLSQWVDRIKEFYGIDNVPIIQGTKDRWKDSPIAVAMLQTLVSRTYDPEFYNYWNLIILDECHRLGAETFSQVCWQFPGERWGLSATPKRYDCLDIVFRLHLGEVCYTHLEQEIIPSAYFIETGAELTPYKKYTLWNGEVNVSKIITDLARNADRNNMILSYLERAYNTGRNILVLGERLDQLQFLYDAMSECPSKAMCIGATKANDRTNGLKSRVIFATHQIAKEGLDKPDLDTLFILIPFANEGRLQQSVGRILRSQQGKATPVVMVFYDASVQIMAAFMRKMKKWFLKNKYNVKDTT